MLGDGCGHLAVTISHNKMRHLELNPRTGSLDTALGSG